MAAVETANAGTSTTYHALGRATGDRTSPMPSAKALSPKTKNGTPEERALEFAGISSRLNNESADAQVTLAWVLYQLKRPAEAEQALRNGLQLGSLSPDSSFLVAKLITINPLGIILAYICDKLRTCTLILFYAGGPLGSRVGCKHQITFNLSQIKRWFYCKSAAIFFA